MAKFCENCGTKIENENQAFCLNCGAKIGGQPTTITNSYEVTGKLNTMALTGFIVSLCSLFLYILVVPGPLGIVFSIIGMKQIKEREERGNGFAIAGLIVGIIMSIVTFLFYMAIFAFSFYSIADVW